MFAYACVLDVDRELVRYVARLLRAERRRIGTRRGTRLPTPFKQALFALAWLRDRSDVQRLGAGFGLSRSTAYRYPDSRSEYSRIRLLISRKHWTRLRRAGTPI
ncbi:hypothetical protein [Actinospica sp.]|uniref:hypothetical protein n=1 Tax=Actinospica sp. TaxID=1872142 RepID=UPI002C6BFC37|nr:hypothetical protein [Actinospica sp.]HWG25451.1 hypothetical protein [Actinospica sp.]